MTETNENKQAHDPSQSELGKKTAYDPHYNPKHLFPIPRVGKREEIGVDPNNIPFFGFDCWNHYEVSWLNNKGKPMVAIAEIYYDCSSPCIIESKSMKLYFNSFNNSQFNNAAEVAATITSDLEKAVQSDVTVMIHPLEQCSDQHLRASMDGKCIDDLDVTCSDYLVEPNYLTTQSEEITETLCSHLLKSNCLVTKQPDWGSVQITYTGNKIDHEGLLKYIVSFRNHNEFHEQCVERIFVDIMNRCKPSSLTVSARYTRRGGLDINPYRSSSPVTIKDRNSRLIRQ